jgi:hypothetical protein
LLEGLQISVYFFAISRRPKLPKRRTHQAKQNCSSYPIR